MTKVVTVQLQDALRCPPCASGRAVDLAAARNHDGPATVCVAGRGQLRQRRVELRAALLPAAGAWDRNGVTYAARVTSGTTPNFVEGRGQRTLPADVRFEVYAVSLG